MPRLDEDLLREILGLVCIAEHPRDGSDDPVLVRLDDAWQLGILMGPTAEGSHSVVFIMDSPTPQAGAVMIVEKDRVRATDIPLTKAFGALSARGLGLGELVKLNNVA